METAAGSCVLAADHGQVRVLISTMARQGAQAIRTRTQAFLI